MRNETGDRRACPEPAEGLEAGCRSRGERPFAPAAFFLAVLLLAVAAAPLGAAEGAEAAPAPWWQIPLQVLNFVVLFGVLGYLLRKPAREFFAGRTRAIQQSVAEARAAREQAEKRLAEVEERLKRLGEEIGALEDEARREAAAERDRLRAAAQVEAGKILAAAESEITNLTRVARRELKSYAARLAVELAEERLRREMNPDTQDRLLRAYAEDLAESASKAAGSGKAGGV